MLSIHCCRFMSSRTVVQAPQWGRTTCDFHGHLSWALCHYIFASDSNDKLRARFIQFSNSRKLGRVMSVLGDGLRVVPAKQIILPKWGAFSVMPCSTYSIYRLRRPCCTKSPSTELALKTKVFLLGPAEHLIVLAHGSWARWAPLASLSPAQWYLHCQPGWLLVYIRTSSSSSATRHTCHFATQPPPAMIWIVSLLRKPGHAGGASSPSAPWVLSPADLRACRFSPPASWSAWNKEWAWPRINMVSCKLAVLRRGPVDVQACPCYEDPLCVERDKSPACPPAFLLLWCDEWMPGAPPQVDRWRKHSKSVWGRDKERERSSTRYCHGQNRLNLRKLV